MEKGMEVRLKHRLEDIIKLAKGTLDELHTYSENASVNGKPDVLEDSCKIIDDNLSKLYQLSTEVSGGWNSGEKARYVK